MNTELFNLILVGAIVGATSGYLGSFMVLKRMSLVGDALSHVALPGIAIAIALGIHPMLGALTALFLSTFGIWFLSENSEIHLEAVVGVFFTASLALGLLITPDHELLEALFGNIDNIAFIDGLLTILGSLIVFLCTYLISKNLILSVISDDLAISQKVNVKKINLAYLLLVALIVGLGIKFLGTLLTGAMVIIPAVTAKNISKSMKYYQINSVFIGILSAAVGIYLAKYLTLPSGPIVVLTGVTLFLLSYLVKKK